MSTNVFLAPPPILQFFNNAGQPNAGGSVLTQVGGVNYPTYQDSGGNTALPNPIPLNSRGEISNTSGISCQLFLVAGVTYVFTQYDANGNQINQATWVGSSAILTSDYSSGNLSRVVSSIAALRALSHAAFTVAFATGYYGPHDGGGGNYEYDATDTTSTDNGGTIIVANDGGRWKLSTTTPVTTKQFGAKADGATLDDSAVANWWTWCALGNPGYVSSGVHKMSLPMVWDVKNSATTGVTIDGAGTEEAYFDLTSVTSSQPFQIISTAGGGAFYSKFQNFGIHANYNGVACQIGQESLADELNVFTFEIYVSNVSTGSSACGIESNFVLNSHFRNCVSDCAGATIGEALRLRRTQFCTFEGGSYSNALTSCHLTNDYNFGNVWLAPDFEVSGTNVVIDSAQSANNTWIGGQWQWTTVSINGTAGNNNRFIGNNFASAGSVVSGSTGVIVYGPKAIGTEEFGGLLLSPPAGDGAITINSVTANSDDIVLQQAGVTRWQLQRDGSTNLNVQRFNSSGVQIDTPLSIEPTQGVTTVKNLQLQAITNSTATSASPGGASGLPATPAGYLTFTLGTSATVYKIPFFNT